MPATLKGYEPEVVEKVKDMYLATDEDGEPKYTVRQIQREVGFASPGSVNNIVRQLQIPMRREQRMQTAGVRAEVAQAEVERLRHELDSTRAECDELRGILAACQQEKASFAERGIDALMSVYRLDLNEGDLKQVVELLDGLLRPDASPVAERRKTA